MKKYTYVLDALAMLNKDFQLQFDEYQQMFDDWYSQNHLSFSKESLKKELMSAIVDNEFNWKKKLSDYNVFFFDNYLGEKIAVYRTKEFFWKILFPELALSEGDSELLVNWFAKHFRVGFSIDNYSEWQSLTDIINAINNHKILSRYIDFYDVFCALNSSGIFSYVRDFRTRYNDILIRFENTTFSPQGKRFKNWTDYFASKPKRPSSIY